MIFQSHDGAMIFHDKKIIAKNKKKASILIIHGLGEHSGRYQALAKHFNKLGIDVFSFDLRGHGRSQGTRGHFESISQLSDDVQCYVQHLLDIKDLEAGEPLYVLGHSLGGLVATYFVANFKREKKNPTLEGLILSAPAFGLGNSPLRKIQSGLAKQVPSFFQAIQIPTGIQSKQLTHDHKEQKKYDADPLVHGWISPSAYSAMEKAIADLYSLIPSLDIPTLFMLCGRDSVVDTNAAENFFQRLQIAHSEKISKIVFSNFYHEPFHELNRKRAVGELTKWIAKQLGMPTTKRLKQGSFKLSKKKAIEKATSL
ncbi:MAG: lysophospholipase [Oligoflexia bacterium]|nr:lysophospholipase [Oligoflexia bacterium]